MFLGGPYQSRHIPYLCSKAGFSQGKLAKNGKSYEKKLRKKYFKDVFCSPGPLPHFMPPTEFHF